MSIAVLGSTGRIGSRIVRELSERGHPVTALARDPDKAPDLPGVSRIACDLNDSEHAVHALGGHAIVVSAVRFGSVDTRRLIEIVTRAGPQRWLVVGGAASLMTEEGVRLIDTPDFPEAWKPEAAKGVAFLEQLKAQSAVDWTFLSPAALMVPGTRTGHYRTGTDTVLTRDGESRISFDDLAVAMADEIDRAAFRCARFTVAY